MLKKRVIFTLLYDSGSFMLSRNFRLQKVGDLRWLQKNYNFSKVAFFIDELVILDVTRGKRDKKKFLDHVHALTKECFVPIAAGGGIRTIEYARELIGFGADKIVVNSLVAKNPEIISELVTEFGSQCVLAAVDVKQENQRFCVWTENGTVQQAETLDCWLNKLNKLCVGEIYLNSIDKDGTGQGYQENYVKYIPDEMVVPVILAGGAGKWQHFKEGLSLDRIDAVATANLFNFIGNGLEIARATLIKNGFDLPVWNNNLAGHLKGIFSSNNEKHA